LISFGVEKRLCVRSDDGAQSSAIGFLIRPVWRRKRYRLSGTPMPRQKLDNTIACTSLIPALFP
jgi:hypothetical protein